MVRFDQAIWTVEANGRTFPERHHRDYRIALAAKRQAGHPSGREPQRTVFVVAAMERSEFNFDPRISWLCFVKEKMPSSARFSTILERNCVKLPETDQNRIRSEPNLLDYPPHSGSNFLQCHYFVFGSPATIMPAVGPVTNLYLPPPEDRQQ